MILPAVGRERVFVPGSMVDAELLSLFFRLLTAPGCLAARLLGCWFWDAWVTPLEVTV